LFVYDFALRPDFSSSPIPVIEGSPPALVELTFQVQRGWRSSRLSFSFWLIVDPMRPVSAAYPRSRPIGWFFVSRSPGLRLPGFIARKLLPVFCSFPSPLSDLVRVLAGGS